MSCFAQHGYMLLGRDPVRATLKCRFQYIRIAFQDLTSHLTSCTLCDLPSRP